MLTLKPHLWVLWIVFVILKNHLLIYVLRIICLTPAVLLLIDMATLIRTKELEYSTFGGQFYGHTKNKNLC